MERRLDHGPDKNLELRKSAPGMWLFPTHHKHCCIYRVPHRLRRVNPDAYTPQLVLIGPLHHSLKFQAPDITNTRLMGYLNMEEHKKIYLSKFADMFEGEKTIDECRQLIIKHEGIIRESYSESTAWIESRDFVEMILHDSVFILEFFLKIFRSAYTQKTGDLIKDQPCIQITVYEDLILLENQLPFFILEELTDTFFPKTSFRDVVLTYFGFTGKIGNKSKFEHFTDLFRCVRVEKLGGSETPTNTKFRYLDDIFRRVRMGTHGLRESTKTKFKYLAALFGCVPTETHESRESTTKDRFIKHMYNAAKLYGAGVKFEAVKDELSIDVTFENGCLRIPYLWVRDDAEIILRNIMALEQCHYPYNAYVCNYVNFLDFLIDTHKDVDLLVEKGIINNWIGEQSLVAEMVNKLFVGVIEIDSYYYDIALKVNAYYENPVNRSRAVLGRMYFGNIWTGTATVAATLLLVMTLIQTVASILQVTQKQKPK